MKYLDMSVLSVLSLLNLKERVAKRKKVFTIINLYVNNLFLLVCFSHWTYQISIVLA